MVGGGGGVGGLSQRKPIFLPSCTAAGIDGHTHTHTHTHCREGIDRHYSKKSEQPFKGVLLTSSAVQYIGIYLKDNAEMLESKLMKV